MDRKFPKSTEIERLIQTSHAARCFLDAEATSLRQRLDFPTRIRSSVKHHPTGWLAGFLASGLAAGLMFRRKPVVVDQKRRSLPAAFLGLTLTAVRPVAKVWLTGQVKNFLATQLGRSQARTVDPGRSHSHPQS